MVDDVESPRSKVIRYSVIALLVGLVTTCWVVLFASTSLPVEILLLLVLFILGIPLLERVTRSARLAKQRFARQRRRQQAARKYQKLTVQDLARRLKTYSAEELLAFRPSYRYEYIPRRSGGEPRKLTVPDAATANLQRSLLHLVFNRLRVHDAVTGFEKQRSIVDHARPHTGKKVVVCLDIYRFFPSTQAERLNDYFQRVGWVPEAAKLLVDLTTYEGGLPQGAPTSPKLSNVVNYGLDVMLARVAKTYRAEYTRYADDLAFSADYDRGRRVRGLIQHCRSVLKYHGYRLHNKKTRIMRRHQRQQITGLVVNDQVQLPRERRRWLRAVRHRAETQGYSSLTPSQLDGWEAWERMILWQRDHPSQFD